MAAAVWVNRPGAAVLPPATDPAAYDHLRALMAGSDRERTLGLARELAAGHPAEPHLVSLLMDVLLSLDDPGAAVPLGQRALEANPEYHGLRVRLGLALARNGQRQAAEAELQRVVAERPGTPRALLEIGKLYHHDGRLHDAVDYYRRALAAKEALAEGHMLLGTALAEGSDLAGAEVAFTRAAALGFRSTDALVNLGQVQLRRRDMDAARASFQRALRGEPDSQRAAEALAQLERLTPGDL